MEVINNFISPEEEEALIDFFRTEPWRQTKRRRMLAYGFQYSKGDHHMNLRMTTPIPDIIAPILERIQAHCHTIFNQMTVNCYESGYGIDPHYDHLTHFGPIIVGLSLGSQTTLIFEHCKEGSSSKAIKEEFFLERRSLYIMSGPYRYEFRHGIRNVHYDFHDGVEIRRQQRISLTFRFVNQPSDESKIDM